MRDSKTQNSSQNAQSALLAFPFDSRINVGKVSSIGKDLSVLITILRLDTTIDGIQRPGTTKPFMLKELVGLVPACKR
jgi:hypothetical protein